VSATGRDDVVDGAGLLLPGTALRSAVLVAGSVAWALVVAGRPLGLVLPVIALLLLVGAAWLPGSAVPLVFLAALALGQLTAGGLDWRVPLLALSMHVVHQTCALAAFVPVGARWEAGMLRALAGRFAQAQGVGVVVFAAAVAAAGTRWRGSETVVLLAGAVVVAVAAFALRRATR
jgi:hypothetical protein